MKTFMDHNFMLHSASAQALYHDYAKDMPIFDYHCHLSPQEIAENRSFRSITEIWLGGDHYKWRAMRSHGIEERYITGDASDKEKFEAWAKTVPYCIGNPLYHWTHLELQRYFDYQETLGPHNWERAWKHCNEVVQRESFKVRSIIANSGVKVICTTDDPIDSLEYHEQIKQLPDFDVVVLPTYRPDKAVEIKRAGYRSYVDALGTAAGLSIESYSDLLQALELRANYFDQAGCRLSDHGIEYVPYEACTLEEAEAIFAKARSGETVSSLEEAKYKTYTLVFLGKLYAKLNWTMQIHMGALRNNNTRMFNQLGPDTGYDSIGDFGIAAPLNKYLDVLDQEDRLPRTILYNLNGSDNDVLSTMIGNFQAGGVKGKLQFGSGWWFNDTKDGMIKQMTSLANQGLLSSFVGMLTDSRSFLSYTRHEYFRRILCNLIGEWMEQGEIPADYEHIGAIVQDICYHNAVQYFGIPVK